MCKHKWLVYTDVILTSYPPKYMCRCKNCGAIDYINCSELSNTNNYEETNGMLNQLLNDDSTIINKSFT